MQNEINVKKDGNQTIHSGINNSIYYNTELKYNTKVYSNKLCVLFRTKTVIAFKTINLQERVIY